MTNYRSSHYQIDVIEEVTRQANVYFYGPGYPRYNKKDSIKDVIIKSQMQPDCIIMGHKWLEDRDGEEVDLHPALELDRSSVPKIAILNKEYTNLYKKLEFIKRNKFDHGFTHHHDTDKYKKLTEIPFEFWPFAVSHYRLKDFASEKERQIDIGFAGILQNQNTNANQSDVRVEILKKFFYAPFDIPVINKRSYREYNVFWAGIPRKKSWQRLAHLLQIRQFLPPKEYYEVLHNSKSFINSLSPMGLIGPRYYDIMASKCLLLCIKTPLYSNIFPINNFVEFRPDLKDFDEKVVYYLNNKQERLKIVEKAYHDVLENHTWEKRVKFLLNVL